VSNHDQSGRPNLTPLAEAAAQMHELYTAWQAAGFTQQEALYLLGVVLQSGQQSGATGAAAS